MPAVAAVSAEVPEPLISPVRVVAPVPPLATGKVPVTPVDNGRPVALVSVAADGVPRFGVTSAGELERTRLPVPVEVAVPVPPEEAAKGVVSVSVDK